MLQLKQYNYILFLGFFFLQQSICSACNVIFNVELNTPSCAGDSDGKITITVINGTAPFVYSFDGGTTFSTENFIKNLSAGDYEIVVQDADGCDDSKNIFLSEPDLLLVELGEDISVNLGDEVEIPAQILGAYESIYWSSTDFENPLPTPNNNWIELHYLPINSHTIYVYLENENCIVADSIFVKVEKFDDIFIPNVFTPNGDGNNDYFNIYGGNSILKINKLQVLDNWGGVVYEAFNFSAHNASIGWDGRFDGKNMEPNIYVYCVEAEYLDGEIKTFCGDVLLMRDH